MLNHVLFWHFVGYVAYSVQLASFSTSSEKCSQVSLQLPLHEVKQQCGYAGYNQPNLRANNLPTICEVLHAFMHQHCFAKNSAR